LLSFYYKFGLNIASDFPIDGLKINKKEALDVVITTREHHRSYDNKSFITLVTEKPEEFFTIKDLHNISISPLIHELEDPLKLFLVNTALFHLFTKRGGICLHGSAVNYNGNGIIFSGASKSGKSTIAAAFCKMGYNHFSDDQSFIYSENGKSYIAADRSNLKLKSDAIVHLNISSKKIKKTGIKDKFEFKSYQSDNIKLPLSRIYYLEPDTYQNKIVFSKTSRIDSLKILVKNTSSKGFLFNSEYNCKLFNLFYKLSSQVPVINIKYSKKGSLIMKMAKKIELDCKKHV